jgi:hypothetical protein
MVAQIKDFTDREIRAVLDYVSRLEPPDELRAPDGWRNPDFMQPVVVVESEPAGEGPTP